MTITQNYRNSFMEVYKILNILKYEDYKKIPKDIISAIDENKNENYEYNLDENLKLTEQKMLPETKAILFNLFRDYLATSEQRTKIIRMQNEERQKNEEEKQLAYKADVFANKVEQNKNDFVGHNNEQSQIVIYKECIFRKMLNKIKSFFVK